MRILGIDYGKKRIGLSISDSNEIVATGLPTRVSQGIRQDIDFIKELIEQYEVGKVVLGLPLNMDGSEGKKAAHTRKFGDVLKRVTAKEVIYQDERLSSVEAEEILSASGVYGKARIGIVDRLAAQVILQSYLEKKRKSTNQM